MAENTQVDVKSDVKKLTFERAIEELESIVTRLEDGKVPLEESVADLRARRGSEAALRGTAAAGRSPRRQDHHRRRRPGDRYGAARRSMMPSAHVWHRARGIFAMSMPSHHART